jgi:nucleoid-associated protein YgaU
MLNQRAVARLAVGCLCLGVAAAWTAGCGRKVLRLADVSSGDYYRSDEFEHLSEEQRAEYCQDLADEYGYQSERRQDAEAARAEALAALASANREAGDLRNEIAGLAARVPSGRPAPTSVHVVRRGETLWGIARRVLGAGMKWKEIFDANRDRVSDPDLLRVGTELRVPAGATPDTGERGS